jgi:hypothetical protein
MYEQECHGMPVAVGAPETIALEGIAIAPNEPGARTGSPIGCLRSISSTLKRLARKGDVEGLRAYVSTDTFLAAFNGLAPERRRSAMRAFAKAEALCEAKAYQPLAVPKRIDAKRVEKVDWGDQGMRERLAAAYVRAGGNDEKAARILGVTLGSARLAKRRHLDGYRQKPVASRRDGNLC